MCSMFSYSRMCLVCKKMDSVIAFDRCELNIQRKKGTTIIYFRIFGIFVHWRKKKWTTNMVSIRETNEWEKAIPIQLNLGHLETIIAIYDPTINAITINDQKSSLSIAKMHTQNIDQYKRTLLLIIAKVNYYVDTRVMWSQSHRDHLIVDFISFHYTFLASTKYINSLLQQWDDK